MAKDYWIHVIRFYGDGTFPIPAHIPIYGEQWQLWQGEDKVIHPSTHQLYQLIQGPITHQWWIRNGHITPEADPVIDWAATQDTMQNLPHYLQQWVTKHASHNCGVGTTLVGWNMQDDARCPRCRHEHEDTTHVTQCRGQGADAVWDTSLKNIEKYFSQTRTDPTLATLLIDCLNQWRMNLPMQAATAVTTPIQLQQAIAQQDRIGWQSLFEGLASHHWRKWQHNYYIERRIRKSSKKWISGLLRLLIQTGQKQWKHRFDYKHYKGKPRHLLMVERLNHEIIREILKGDATLLPGDKYRVRASCMTILSKPLPSKKGWLVNIASARQRYLRIQHQQDDLQTHSRETSTLITWMRTARTR